MFRRTDTFCSTSVVFPSTFNIHRHPVFMTGPLPLHRHPGDQCQCRGQAAAGASLLGGQEEGPTQPAIFRTTMCVSRPAMRASSWDRHRRLRITMHGYVQGWEAFEEGWSECSDLHDTRQVLSSDRRKACSCRVHARISLNSQQFGWGFYKSELRKTVSKSCNPLQLRSLIWTWWPTCTRRTLHGIPCFSSPKTVASQVSPGTGFM